MNQLRRHSLGSQKLKTIFLAIIFIFVFFGCAKQSSLNYHPHGYGQVPHRIVWLQVPGITADHLAMLRFSFPNAKIKTSFEKSMCMGQMWGFNSFTLRPNAAESSWSQLTGKKNIKNSCEDYNHKPIWDYLDENSFTTGVIERSGRDNTLLKDKSCSELKNKHLKNIIFWKMGKAQQKNDELFFYQNKKEFSKGNVYYDRSCQKGSCFTALSENVFALYESFRKKTPFSFFLVRDLSFYESLKMKKVAVAKEKLFELEKIFSYFLNEAQKDNNMLVLLSSGAPRNIEFPKEGRTWQKFDERAKYVTYKRGGLSSPVFAYGARAENFCGFFEESEILSRLSQQTPGTKLKFYLINPFQ